MWMVTGDTCLWGIGGVRPLYAAVMCRYAMQEALEDVV